MREQSPITAGIMELLSDGKAYTRAEIVSALSDKLKMDNKKKNALGALLHYQTQRGRIIKEGNTYRALPLRSMPADMEETLDTKNTAQEGLAETMEEKDREPETGQESEAAEEKTMPEAKQELKAAEEKKMSEAEQAPEPEKKKRGRPRKSEEEKAAEKELRSRIGKQDSEEKAERRKTDRSGRNALREARNKAREERRAAREARDREMFRAVQNDEAKGAAEEEGKTGEEKSGRDFLALTSKVPAVKPNAILELEGCMRRMYLEAEKAAVIMRGDMPYADLSDAALRNVLTTYEKIVRAKKELE